jgi:hypothetical protein
MVHYLARRQRHRLAHLTRLALRNVPRCILQSLRASRRIRGQAANEQSARRAVADGRSAVRLERANSGRRRRLNAPRVRSSCHPAAASWLSRGETERSEARTPSAGGTPGGRGLEARDRRSDRRRTRATRYQRACRQPYGARKGPRRARPVRRSDCSALDPEDLLHHSAAHVRLSVIAKILFRPQAR